MDFSLTEEQVLLRDSAREFLTTEWPVAELRRMLEPDDAPNADCALWSKIAGLGWPGLLIREEYEGLGLGIYDLAVLMEVVGKHLIPGTYFASGILASLALETLGNEESCQKYLPEIAEGRLKATLGVYEPGSGWNAMMLQTPSKGSITKRFVPSAAGANLILFLNRTDGNDIELAVATESTFQDLNSMDVTRPLYEVECSISRLEPVGKGTIGDLQSIVDKATIALSAEMVGGTAQLVDMTVKYIKNRQQFGRPVGSFQAVQHKAVDMLIALEQARTAVFYAAAVADEQPDNLARAASMAKSLANTAYTDAGEKAIQLHGGIGFTWEQDLHLYLKRAKACQVGLGDTKWHLDRIAHLLGAS